MKRFLVVANPRGGTCRQLVSAETKEEAISKAKNNPNGWVTADPRDAEKDWNYRAYEKENRREHHRRGA